MLLPSSFQILFKLLVNAGVLMVGVPINQVSSAKILMATDGKMLDLLKKNPRYCSLESNPDEGSSFQSVIKQAHADSCRGIVDAGKAIYYYQYLYCYSMLVNLTPLYLLTYNPLPLIQKHKKTFNAAIILLISFKVCLCFWLI
jgi:hypothetical protein